MAAMPIIPQQPSQAWPPLTSPLFDEHQGEASRGKRSRVALACQRCKTRKQKCNGTNPCEKCEANKQHCEYVIPHKPMPFGKQHYIKALERRVAELETMLATSGMVELTSDHWSRTAAPTAATTTATSVTGSSTQTDISKVDLNEEILEWRDGVDSVASVLRSLSLDVNGSGYVGASSHIAFGRLFSFIGVRDGRRLVESHSRHPASHLQSGGGSEDTIEFAEMPDNVADRLFGGYLKHIATRWPFIHSVWAREIHGRRHALTDVFEITMLHLVYATAGRFVETTGETGNFHAKRHYNTAVRPIDTVLAFNNVRSVQALMLMAVYCLRDPVGVGAWICSRTALLIVIDHGMHRQTQSLCSLSMASQLRKRLFWACYSFDRQISIPMGRPFGIADRDIDIELPLNINEDTTEEQLARSGLTRAVPSKSTSLTSFILVVQLRRIESEIQQTIYRVDRSNLLNDSVVDNFLFQLKAWKSKIPSDTQSLRDISDIPFDGYEYYMVYYYKCQRLLLYPQILKADVAHRFLKGCAQACAGVCGAYKRLHQTLAVGYSLMALQTVFMAGLTLVYCLWISPEDIFDSTTSNGIHDCSIVLFVIAERVPAAKKYRNAFEVIRQRVIDRISTKPPAERRSRERVIGLTAELAVSASFSFETNRGSDAGTRFDVDDGSLEQLSHILTDMTGEQFAGYTDGSDAHTAGYINETGFAASNDTDTSAFSVQVLAGHAHDVDLGRYSAEFPSSYDFAIDPAIQPR
ncbi:hypothetical protein K504DRAFT_417739 [Pleomassaria siparia CBS 279.74]|uniref:Zn(2)-C6 fungal-type domain-containing protein n=1 Tax=Pleomassaria siparia CBS 279.74 TaxID=1314801 RepID=A0A6G1JTZ8_9PLEO|nr:hypothetical protein K504DRAFT_417739 [Pleomassaria siparia CBS 279.74]